MNVITLYLVLDSLLLGNEDLLAVAPFKNISLGYFEILGINL